MKTMISSLNTNTSHYNDLQEFLTKHSNSKTSGNQKTITHTRIGSQELNVYPGAYSIEADEMKIFRKLYYEHIFVKNRKEYLTEKQLNGNGPIAIDFDFRYAYNVTERIHTTEHIQDIVSLYLEELKEIFVFEKNKPFPIFIMEKPNVNRVVEKQITKDGIHMIIGIQMDHILQIILREKIISQIGDVWELPLTNTWEDVLDVGISKGCTNWQMYGSQKPGHEAYKLTYYLTAELNEDDNNWTTTAKSIKDLDLSTNLDLLSVQYDNHIKFEINPKIKEEYNKRLEDKSKKVKKSESKTKINLLVDEQLEDTIELSDITNYDTLKKGVDYIMSKLKTNEQFIKETHEYTQILPEKYYQPGSHLINRKVAFALKHTDERLFLSWVMLRSKASDFDYNTIPNLYNEWKKHFHKTQDGVTRASIMYWAKQDAYSEYEKVKKGTINQYIEDTIFEAGDWDYAMVLYHLFKDKYVCSSITNKKWYVFNKHRWEKDEGQRLRMAISKDLFELYSEKQNQYLSESQLNSENGENEKIQRKIKRIAEICIKLKKTNDKNNIMREAMEIFFDKDFSKNIDSNPYLMCFTNGVFDFKTKEFRDGYPQDYITKTTNIHYTKFNPTTNVEIVNEITQFMAQLFPLPDLCRYMWDHLGSVLIGIKKEHAFNIYRGSGSNGKSILTDLMSQCLGDYKGTVPITLVTDKRSSIGGATPEIMQLKGVRYAVMQEPSKDAIMNEGIMKELTGGDPLLGRALYSDSEIFIPQFSLVVCTNALFEMKTNDDGTWRRMKLVDFLSKFISEGESHTDDTKYVFLKNKSLKENLPKWAPIFMSMLIKRVCETNGEVNDCLEVISASEKYRQSQDAITGFIRERIIKVDKNLYGVSKTSLNNVFKDWFQMNFGNRKAPKLSELLDGVTKQFGHKHLKTNKWYNIQIKEESDEDLDAEGIEHEDDIEHLNKL
jgi:P4 family phage/plasmid primase-like protien